MPARSLVTHLGREEDPAKRLRKAWGDAIRQTRKFRGMTIEDLVGRMAEVSHDKVQVTAAAVGMWERGETAPRWENQVACAKALGEPHARLFAITEEAA